MMNTLKMPKNGFSLVEVMVVLGLLGGLAVFMMNLSQRGTKVNKQTKSENEINSWQREISSYFTDANACRKSMLLASGGGIQTTAIPPAGSVNISKVYKKTCTSILAPPDQYNTCTQEAYSTGTVREGVTLTSMVFQNYNNTDKTAKLALNFSYSLGSNQQMTKTRIIPLNLDTTSAPDHHFVSCNTSSTNYELNPLEVCNIALGFSVNAIAGTGAGENPYFSGGTCHFKFAARKEACKNEGGLFVRPVRSNALDGYLVTGRQNYTNECLATDIQTTDEDKCYCKTSWRKFIPLIDGARPGAIYNHDVVIDVPIQREQPVGGPFLIPELFPTDVGMNIASNSANNKSRVVKLTGFFGIQLKVPYVDWMTNPSADGYDYPYDSNPFLAGPQVDIAPRVWDSPNLPNTLIEAKFVCRNSRGIPGAGNGWQQQASQSVTNMNFSPAGNYDDGFMFLLAWGCGGLDCVPLISGNMTRLKIFGSPFGDEDINPALVTNLSSKFPSATIVSQAIRGGPSWINQNFMQVEAVANLAPGDKCYLSARPLTAGYGDRPGVGTANDYSYGPGEAFHLDYAAVTLKIFGAYVIIEQNTNRGNGSDFGL